MAQLGVIYGWTLHYCMEELTYSQAMAMWRRGVQAKTGDDPTPDDVPDLERFHELYGTKIKRG